MKKKLLLTVLALICALTCAFGLAACGDGADGGKGDGGKKPKPVDLTQYLGTDEELSAMTPTDDKYFTFTPLADGNSYEVSCSEQYRTELYEIKKLVIPGVHDGKKVAQIAERGFSLDNWTGECYIQPGVERICDYAFANSHDVACWFNILQIPSTLKAIGKNAVSCNVFKAGNGLETVEADNNIRFAETLYVDEGDFIKDITTYTNNPVCFPDSLKYCESVPKIPKNTAGHAEKDGVKYFGNPNNPYMIAYDGKQAGKPQGETISLPEGCKSVMSGAFSVSGGSASSGKKIEKLIFPKTCTRIGDSSFYSAHVEKVTFSENLEYIGRQAFAKSDVTGEIEFPDSVKYIGDNAFTDCQYLTGVIALPASIEYVSPNAFQSTKIVSTTVYGKCSYLGTPDNPYYYLLRAGKYTGGLDPDTEKGYQIHPDTKVIAAGAFNDAEIVWDSTLADDPDFNMDSFVKEQLTVTVPDGVVLVGSRAFFSKEHVLRGVSLPGNWTEWESGVNQLRYYLGNNFSESGSGYDRYGSASVIIREGYTEIADGAFEGIGNLDTLTLPAGITKIGKDIFGQIKVYELTAPAAIINNSSMMGKTETKIKHDADAAE